MLSIMFKYCIIWVLIRRELRTGYIFLCSTSFGALIEPEVIYMLYRLDKRQHKKLQKKKLREKGLKNLRLLKKEKKLTLRLLETKEMLSQIRRTQSANLRILIKKKITIFQVRCIFHDSKRIFM